MARINMLLLLLGALMSFVSAGAPTFCKCTCFKNSTIIPLGPASESEPDNASASPQLSLRSMLSRASTPGHQPAHRSDSGLDGRSASSSCSQCTKAFCLSQGIDFCKDAEEDDVVTMCFQRDSNKDKIIVWAFIIGTVGLLGWATFKRIVEFRELNGIRGIGVGSQQAYAPVQ